MLNIRKNSLAVLFSVVAFLGAGLIFIVEPLVAKLLLPPFGGSSNVWNTASLFFQVTLLVGYILVHLTFRFGAKKQLYLLLPLLIVSAVILPITLPTEAVPADANPIMWVLRFMFLMIGFPFLVLSTTGPLLQKWYSWSDGPRKDDPYFIYAASNAGSFIGLLGYPLVIEPRMTLSDQRTIWSMLFVAFVALLIFCCLTVIKSKPPVVLDAAGAVVRAVAAKIPLGKQAFWVFLAFVPSSLMLGTTTYISTDIASIPLLWIIPLALYLLTMILAFGSKRTKLPRGLVEIAVLLPIINFCYVVNNKPAIEYTIGSFLVAFTLIAYAAHSALAASRPPVENLTKFFVLVSFGGALGGFFNGFIAPQFFSIVMEFPLVIGLLPILLFSVIKTRKWIVFPMAALLSGLLVFQQFSYATSSSIFHDRTFYGAYTVDQGNVLRQLVHGNTIHGVEPIKDGGTVPTTYYAKTGALGDVFESYDWKRVGAVGLGVGTIAAYGEKDRKITFFEIDPLMKKIAEKYFHFLSKSKSPIEIQLGDGRKLVNDYNGKFDLLVLDAFSSDSIPVHLLTTDAFKEYSKKLDKNGTIAVHVSNRNLNLEPVIVGDAQALGMHVLFRTSPAQGSMITSAKWMVVTNNDKLIKKLSAKGWSQIDGEPPVVWTDDYSSIFSVLRLN